jgi:cytochrome P450
VADPYGAFAALRAVGPLVWLPEHHAWLTTTYDETAAAFRDPRLSSDRLTPLERSLDPARAALLGPTFELLRGWMVFHDPPDHERLRGPLRRAFTPRTVEGLRPRVGALVDELLDGVQHRPTWDLVRELAFPLPAIVIAELLGVPPADRERFKTWSNQLGAVVFGASNRPDQAEQAAAGSAQFADYFGWLVAKYTAEPADNLVSALIAVTRDDAASGGSGLTPAELVGTCTLLLFGGHETTTNLIGNAALALLRAPDQRAWLRDHPSAMGGAVDELLRFDGPTKLMVRTVHETHERGGHELVEGQLVFLGVAAGNRDPAAFAEPDELRLDRADAVRHLGFGYGIHYCLGAPLARLEAATALAGLMRRCPDLRLADDQPGYGATILGRGLTSLVVASG